MNKISIRRSRDQPLEIVMAIRTNRGDFGGQMFWKYPSPEFLKIRYRGEEDGAM